jgi:hypothetical protein
VLSSVAIFALVSIVHGYKNARVASSKLGSLEIAAADEWTGAPGDYAVARGASVCRLMPS